MAHSKAELAKVDAERKYWRKAAKILGLTLSGWTYKSYASMYRVLPHGQWVSYEITGLIADKLIEQDKEIRKLKKASK